MRKTLTILALLTLAACVTPQESCISQVYGPSRALQAQIATAEGNIARGYAIHSQNVPYTYVGTCFNDEGAPYDCQMNGTRVRESPVSIDLTEERRKLARLKRDLATAQAGLAAQVAQCRLAYPE